MTSTYILLVLGIIFLLKSADWIIDWAALLAKIFWVSNLVIGLTIVAFGTSLPELVVNLFAAFKWSQWIAFGNIIGSNIANLLVGFGIMSIIWTIHIKKRIVIYEIPFAILATLILLILTWNIFEAKEFITRNDGLILIFLFIIFLYYLYQSRLINAEKDISLDIKSEKLKTFGKLFLGIIWIYFGGRWVVDWAVAIAELFWLSTFLISATVIALWTSLPELTVSIIAFSKGNTDLAIGNIVGTNIFNIFLVFGIVPLISPIKIPNFVGFDIGMLLLFTLWVFVFIFINKKHKLKKNHWILFLLFYVLYVTYIVYRG